MVAMSIPARTCYHYASDEMSSITHIVGSTHEMGADQVLNHGEKQYSVKTQKLCGFQTLSRLCRE